MPKILRRGTYGVDLKHRFGFLPYLPKSGKKRLWIQAVSVGEVNAIMRLVTLLSQEYEIVLTTTTTTARKMIEERLLESILLHGYFPWDFYPCSCLAWSRLQPDGIVLVESELWPEHMAQAKRRHVPIFLVNGRLSDRSFSRYCRFPKLGRWIFNPLDFIAAASEQDRARIASFYDKKIDNFSNMKFDSAVPLLSPLERKNLKEALGFDNNALVIAGCSTWPGEEALLLKALGKIWESQEKMGRKFALLLVPRHAERCRALIQWLKNECILFSQRSLGVATKKVPLCLGDVTGELAQLVQIADLAYIGKSLAPNEGGQSPIDAAMAGIPIIYGDRMTNFRDICEQLERENAAIKVKNEDEAIEAIVGLAGNAQRRQILAKNVRRCFESNRGASVKTYDFIRKGLGSFHWA
ncbi:MAG: hypothetical protein LBB11_04415 [Puniceicoccales bacterium]|nr:hypothetical protein [Puniceicoccales bacterium]